MKYIMHYLRKLHASSGAALYVNVFGMALSSLLESASLLLLVPLLGLIGIVSAGAAEGMLEKLSGMLDGYSTLHALFIVIGIYLLATLAQNLVYRKMMIHNIRLQQTFSKKLRLEAYKSLLEAEWLFFMRKRNTDLVNTMTIELARVLGAVQLSLQLVSSTIFTVIQICIAVWISPLLTLFVLGCGLLLGVFSGRFIKRAKQLGNQTSMHAQAYLAGISDQINGMKDIKSNTLEQSRLAWLSDLTDGMVKEQMSYIRNRMNSQLLYKLSSAGLIAVFILAGFAFFQTQGIALLIITIIFARLWPRFTDIQSNLEQLAAKIPACQSLYNMQKESLHAAERLRGESADAAPMLLERNIVCRDITFRYDKGRGNCTLRDIRLHIPAKGMTAVVGASGAGKSTLIDIIMGLMQPDEGYIEVDGTAIARHNLLAYRQAISYVPQEPFLFNASIRENLAMLNLEATDEMIWEALEFASCAEFVRKLPDGLDTVIGDRGIRLSGGERQRLVLARAIIRKPSILVLDEATSALDVENELRIQEAIDRLKGNMTIIVVAHRLSTIRNADKVIVMEEGRIAEEGEFAKLAANHASLFGQLLQKQAELRAEASA
ncbi:ABC transporter ATP-binding protein [Paenibacillus chungangensis]|uniref:ABC transporter ATP-binding protein n=1 Tax=Paenibacillus chungangensis TaxID=696535 RepID=A0ABW3HV80_9BACL